jgi:hypothetical protein
MKIVTNDGKCHEKLDFGNYDLFYQTMKHDEIYVMKLPIVLSGYNP